MALHQPLFMQPSGADPDITPTAQEFRRLLDQVFALGGQCVLNGINVPPSGFAVAQRGAGANFSVDIAPGNAYVEGDDIANQGGYFLWNDAIVNLVTPSAPGSGTRIHRVVCQIRDKLANGTYTTYDAQFQLLQDTGGGTPAEPASALTLAFVTITSSSLSVQNAQITDKRVFLSDPWHAATLLHGWSGNMTYRLSQDKRSVHISTNGTITPGTLTDSTVLCTLPAAYFPASERKIALCVDATTGSQASTPYARLKASGDVDIHNLPITTSAIGFEATLPIDNTP